MCVHRCENFPGHVVGNSVHCVFMLVSEKVLPLEIEQGVTGAGGGSLSFYIYAFFTSLPWTCATLC